MKLHKIVFQNAQVIIKQNDPVGLIDGGAPENEYDDQVLKVVSLLRGEVNLENLTNNLKELFESDFGENSHLLAQRYKQLAEKLIELKERLKW